MASISYNPDASQGAYYEALFRTADVKGAGQIGGAEAVQFFSRSRLPVEILKSIWTVADQPSTSYLDHAKFATAVRLIQLTQNGQKGLGPNLAAPPGVNLRPVFFEGVSGVSVPLPGQQQQPAGAGPPPPTPQQQQRSPPRPQQQQPPPQQQQQQQPQQPSPTMSAPPTPSRALVGPDPYSMSPQERARYEALFPQYAKSDGFVYGPEAVALFTKSGVDPTTLRDIWNMVDRAPVDNRLDKLEFAMAMHLIVCISKKNLPPPSGGTLPNSLRALKAVTGKPQNAMSSPTMGGGGDGGSGAPPAPVSPMYGSQMPPPQQQMQMQQQQQQQMQMPPPTPAGQPTLVETVESTPMVGGPPPVEAQGGMSISDAFEGLNMGAPETSSTYASAPEPAQSLPSYVPEVAAPGPSAARSLSPQPSYVSPATSMVPEPAPAPPPAPSDPAARMSAASTIQNYNLGDSHAELDKLKGVLQKLQAENISLKAQLGNMTEEEKDVQRELGATVAEIGKLSSALTVQRQRVLEAKNKLLEASAELKAHQEQKGVLTDLITEAKQTETAILDATQAIQNADKAAQHHSTLEVQKNQAVHRSNMFENALFGYEDSAPAQASTMESDDTTPAPAPAAPTLHESAPNTPAIASRSIPEPVPSTQPSPMPGYGAAPESTLAPAADPGPGYYNYGGPPADKQQSGMFSNEFPQQSPSKPTPTLGRPSAVGDHHRQDSGFGSVFVMGGSAAPLPQEPQPQAPVGHSAARTHSSSGDYGFEDEESFKVKDDMKKKAERAAEAARDAEAASSRLAAEADELRTDADKAEANARTLRAVADEKKKGRFGGGKKKSANREAERAAEDATEIRKRFMAIQTQAHDAQVLAAQTRREANRLKDEAEKAELDMASAASLRDQQNTTSRAPAPTPVPAPVQHSSNGHGHPPLKSDYGYGQPPAGGGGGYGYGGPPEPNYGHAYGMPPPNNNGYPPMSLQNPADAGFGAGVMGGGSGGSGGFDLPSPAQFQGGGESYGGNPTNPF